MFRAMIICSGVALAVAGCSPNPTSLDPVDFRMATPGDVERVIRAVSFAKGQAEDIAVACPNLRFDEMAFARLDTLWTRSTAELAARSPRVLFDGLRRLGYAEPYDVFLDRVRDGRAVPDLAATGEGGQLINLGAFTRLAVPDRAADDVTCADGEMAIAEGALVGTLLRAEVNEGDRAFQSRAVR